MRLEHGGYYKRITYIYRELFRIYEKILYFCECVLQYTYLFAYSFT